MALLLTPHPEPANALSYSRPYRRSHMTGLVSPGTYAALPIVLLTPPEPPRRVTKRESTEVDPRYTAQRGAPIATAVGAERRYPGKMQNGRPSTLGHKQPATHLQVPVATQRPVSQPVAGPSNPLMAYRNGASSAQMSLYNSPVSPSSEMINGRPYSSHPGPSPVEYEAPPADELPYPHQHRVHAISNALQAMTVSHPTSVPIDSRRLSVSSTDRQVVSLPGSIKPTFWDTPFPDKATKDNTSLARNTCSMMCYIWYSDSIGLPLTESEQPSDALPIEEEIRARMQFNPSKDFITFMQGLLSTTQLSRSVVVLALYYVYKLRQSASVPASRGSETRLAVAALMLANKYVDDNTYTNRTWSDVSHLPLLDINKAEEEFLNGINHNLCVNRPTYDAWLKTLKSLATAREQEHATYLRRRSVLRPRGAQFGKLVRARSSSPLKPRIPYPNPPPTTAGYTPPEETDAFYSSPASPILNASPLVKNEPLSPPIRSLGAKRTVNDAFSPESAHLGPPAKRGGAWSAMPNGHRFEPPVQLPPLFIPGEQERQPARTSVQAQPQPVYHRHPSTHRNTIPAPTAHNAIPHVPFTYSMPVPSIPPVVPPVVPSVPAAQHIQPPQTSGSWAYIPRAPSVDTLAAPYQLHNRLPNFNRPHDLYYFSLAASPLDVPENQKPPRKAVLRYHHPAYEGAPLPNAQPVMFAPAHQQPNGMLVLPPPQPDQTRARSVVYSRANAQIAPFANAGSPGVYWTGAKRPWQQEPTPPSRPPSTN
ncbi:hypothetical protein CALVIDRAFT_349622 [Calocera viscosa TUFC12733]|uniref:Cyclin-like domain-containing protein n=1 Tax=Calocera viscosa (strain TUFC12733) TaxID=1330018 RepID=A0A167Q9X9_CALVF|nr:hypothetical protein CALVIDRAFT_349622 [Calocera viscosa TUFC12733]